MGGRDVILGRGVNAMESDLQENFMWPILIAKITTTGPK